MKDSIALKISTANDHAIESTTSQDYENQHIRFLFPYEPAYFLTERQVKLLEFCELKLSTTNPTWNIIAWRHAISKLAHILVQNSTNSKYGLFCWKSSYTLEFYKLKDN